MSIKDKAGSAAEKFGAAIAYAVWALIFAVVLGGLAWLALIIWRAVL